MPRVSSEQLKYFIYANYTLKGLKPQGYILGLDIGSNFFGAAKSLPDLSKSKPLVAPIRKISDNYQPLFLNCLDTF